MPELTVQAPAGAEFSWEEVKTKGGTETLGEHPLLAWKSVDGMTAYYGEEGVLQMADGTSIRVSMQGISRRYAAAGKTDDEIAAAQIAFKPGKRAVGASTPSSRAARQAKAAAEVVNPGILEKLLADIASGKLSEDDVAALVG
jgi:hypothetical protein